MLFSVESSPGGSTPLTFLPTHLDCLALDDGAPPADHAPRPAGPAGAGGPAAGRPGGPILEPVMHRRDLMKWTAVGAGVALPAFLVGHGPPRAAALGQSSPGPSAKPLTP